MYKKIFLKPGKEKSLNRFHLWIFSGAIDRIEGNPQNGEIVEVFSSSKEFLAIGHFQNGSIMIRILSFKNEIVNNDFWFYRIKNALALRKSFNLPSKENTNVYRLIHGEGDFCPGLVIDIYNNSAVIQIHSLGMSNSLNSIVDVLKSFDELNLQNIIVRDEPKNEISQAFGTEKQTIVIENSYKFKIDLIGGQKTGFFIDQRQNRMFLGDLCKNKKVLNLFGYTGGFSVYGASAGAEIVHTVDSSKQAIEMAYENMKLNSVDLRHEGFSTDAFEFLKKMEIDYDLIILDPPAFAKHIKSLSNAREAYIRLNREAIKSIKSGGVIFTFSCSQAVSKEIFRNVVFTAAAQVGRNVRILNQLSQPPDHPVNLFHPETEYLKGLVLYVD